MQTDDLAAQMVREMGLDSWFIQDEIERCEAIARRYIKEAYERAARYIEGHGGVIPGANVFAHLVSGNPMPCMSGDGRDRLTRHTRRQFDDATRALADAVRGLNERPCP